MRFLKYILLLLVGQVAISQNTITSEGALNKYLKTNGILVIEFWAEWNDKKSCSFIVFGCFCVQMQIQITKSHP